MHKFLVIGNLDDGLYSYASHKGLVITDVILQIKILICNHKCEGRKPRPSKVGLTLGQHNMQSD